MPTNPPHAGSESQGLCSSAQNFLSFVEKWVFLVFFKVSKQRYITSEVKGSITTAEFEISVTETWTRAFTKEVSAMKKQRVYHVYPCLVLIVNTFVYKEQQELDKWTFQFADLSHSNFYKLVVTAGC